MYLLKTTKLISSFNKLGTRYICISCLCEQYHFDEDQRQKQRGGGGGQQYDGTQGATRGSPKRGDRAKQVFGGDLVRLGTPPEEVYDQKKLQQLTFKPNSDFNIAFVSRQFLPGLLTNWKRISMNVEKYQRFQQIFEPIMKSKDIHLMRYDMMKSKLYGLFDLLEYKRSKSRKEDDRNIKEQTVQYMMTSERRVKKLVKKPQRQQTLKFQEDF
eukprot:TRINITY_DN5789_c0_g1_i4.p3 TRINITY_DN5789_c0_g1~~TRINITY_DN5789_c0_g1_i4.p3  ORF type:complete len:213 (-),score=22.74 TRINITY_DN5789_c0_g1_i4:379-1017(-)